MTDFVLNTTSDNYFTGLLKVDSAGGDCSVTAGSNPGLIHNTCTDDNAYDSSSYTGQSSDAILSSEVALDTSYIAKVTSDDTANISDSSGTQSYVSIFDWLNFDNYFRGWGRSHADAFPSTNHRGKCNSGETCQIWDWSLASTDVGDLGPDEGVGGGDDVPALLGEVSCPTGDDGDTTMAPIDHEWSASDETECGKIIGATWNAGSSTCTTTYLRNAVEILNDGIDNNNLLCESGETCLYTPNIGSYQGSGSLMAAGSAVSNTDNCADIGSENTISNVTLKKYSTNGN